MAIESQTDVVMETLVQLPEVDIRVENKQHFNMIHLACLMDNPRSVALSPAICLSLTHSSNGFRSDNGPDYLGVKPQPVTYSHILFVSVFFLLSVCLSVYLCLSVSLSLSLSVCVCLSVGLSVSLSHSLSHCLYDYLSLSLALSFCLCLCLTVCLSLSPSLSLSLCI